MMIHRQLKIGFLVGAASLLGLLASTQNASAQYGGSLANMYSTINFASQSL